MKGVTYFDDWNSGCEGAESSKAMEVLGGNQWLEVYEECTAQGVDVVGGNAISVGAAGGYSLGGGHGQLGALYGLAVDNMLEVDVVIADGTLLTANACTNTDLFWALRGGGGGTYGIVTRMVHKAHDKLENYFKWSLRYESPHASGMVVMQAFADFLAYTD